MNFIAILLSFISFSRARCPPVLNLSQNLKGLLRKTCISFYRRLGRLAWIRCPQGMGPRSGGPFCLLAPRAPFGEKGGAARPACTQHICLRRFLSQKIAKHQWIFCNFANLAPKELIQDKVFSNPFGTSLWIQECPLLHLAYTLV